MSKIDLVVMHWEISINIAGSVSIEWDREKSWHRQDGRRCRSKVDVEFSFQGAFGTPDQSGACCDDATTNLNTNDILSVRSLTNNPAWIHVPILHNTGNDKVRSVEWVIQSIVEPNIEGVGRN